MLAKLEDDPGTEQHVLGLRSAHLMLFLPRQFVALQLSQISTAETLAIKLRKTDENNILNE
jgi:hypothetical protein